MKDVASMYASKKILVQIATALAKLNAKRAVGKGRSCLRETVSNKPAIPNIVRMGKTVAYPEAMTDATFSWTAPGISAEPTRSFGG